MHIAMKCAISVKKMTAKISGLSLVKYTLDALLTPLSNVSILREYGHEATWWRCG